MRIRGRDRFCAPPWWPANEPWPPVRTQRSWQRRRARLLGAFIFLLPMFLLVAAGFGWLVSHAVVRLGGPPDVGYFVPMAAWVFFLFVFVLGVRRFGNPVSEIVEASERVADGDFTTRINPRGPTFVRKVGSAFNTMTERLEAHDRQRRELMADIAHELRTPLTVIQGRLEGLLDGVYPRDDERLAGVLEETRVLARLVEDLRTLANAETGILTLQREPTELPPLIQDAVRSLSTEAGGAGALVRIDAPADLPVLNIDPVRIREVLANLLSNALRHSEPGGVVELEAAPAPHRRVLIRVVDHGDGIAAHHLESIFERFYRTDIARDRDHGGSGVGLTISRAIVAAHDGHMWVESDGPGRGAVFSFTLPAPW